MEVSPDARVFTFRLRRDVRWHDGEPFTARDVEFSVSRQLLEPYRYVKYAGEIAGAEAYEEGSSDRLEGLEAIDDFTVRITLGGTDVTFLQKLAEPSMVIIPSHLLAGVEPDAVQSAPFTTTRPVGTGPFRFVKYLTDLYVELESNPDYFRGAPLIRRVYMKRLRPEVTVAQLESGELDLGMRLQLLDYDRLAALSHLETTTRPGIGMISVGFALGPPRGSGPAPAPSHLLRHRSGRPSPGPSSAAVQRPWRGSRSAWIRTRGWTPTGMTWKGPRGC